MLFRLLRTYLRRYRRVLAAVAVLQFLQTMATLFLPTLNANIINKGIIAKIMAKEGNLTEDKSHIHGIQELQPEVVDDQQEDHAHDQQTHCKENLVGIVRRLLV